MYNNPPNVVKLDKNGIICFPGGWYNNVTTIKNIKKIISCLYFLTSITPDYIDHILVKWSYTLII